MIAACQYKYTIYYYLRFSVSLILIVYSNKGGQFEERQATDLNPFHTKPICLEFFIKSLDAQNLDKFIISIF